MSKKVGVLIVHGAGKHERGYADTCIKKIKSRLGKEAHNVAFEEAYWHDQLQPLQQKLFKLLQRNKMGWLGLRSFVISHFGDVVAYQGVQDQPLKVYNRIHQEIGTSISNLKDQLDNGDKAPLIVIAFSMGATIMSNYIWDKQHPKNQRRSFDGAFEDMDTLQGFITIGSTLPLFALCVESLEEITPITFPPKALGSSKEHLWLNIYDKDDVLGYPLTPVPGYDQIERLVDLTVQAGGFFKSMTPLSHKGYLKGPRKMIKPIANFIHALLESS